jgi:hypothetical protein
MNTTPKKLLTILTSESMEKTIIEDLLAAGANGATAVDARGRGAHGVRPSSWASGNVRIEVMGDADMVQRALDKLERFRPETPMVAWVCDVQAWPADKFGG